MVFNKQTLEKLIEIAVEAGEIIMPYYLGDKSMQLEIKQDESPVTLADQLAETYIIEQLEIHFPDIPIVAEEQTASGTETKFSQKNSEYFFLVDPLDGTREFINKRDDFTVNIAIIQKNAPLVGVIYAPANHDIYAGIVGGKAYYLKDEGRHKFILKEEDLIDKCAHNGAMRAVASRSFMSKETKDFMRKRAITDYISVGSSLKFCMLAVGKADIYPRFGRTMEWDIAAGDAILRAIGGITVTIDGKPMKYRKCNQAHDADFANPFFISHRVAFDD